MKIKTSIGEIETSNYDDLKSETLERVDSLFQFCIKNKIPCFINVVHPNKNYPPSVMTVNTNESESDYADLLNAFNGYFNGTEQDLIIIKKSELLQR